MATAIVRGSVACTTRSFAKRDGVIRMITWSLGFNDDLVVRPPRVTVTSSVGAEKTGLKRTNFVF